MQQPWDPNEPLQMFFDTEREGVRVLPGDKEDEIVIHFIQDHFIYGGVFERKSYFDYIRYGAIDWLYKRQEDLKHENAELREKLARMQQAAFGTSSEQSPSPQPDTPAPAADTGVLADDPKVISLPKVRAARNAGRKPLPAHLPRVQVMHDLPEHDRFCPCCHARSSPSGRRSPSN